jgi:DNA phosphorothioation-associated putative methyltransferase
MEISVYRKIIESLPFGKSLPEAIYLHAGSARSTQARALIETAERRANIDRPRYDVIKFARAKPQVSLLAYPDFFDAGFPCLTEAWIVDLATGKLTHRRYAKSGNQPVLHRKELLLPHDNAQAIEFAALTRAAEEAGLFEDQSAIGTRLVWEARVARVGLRVEGNRLVRADDVVGSDHGAPTVLRHRTALARHALSTPMQCLWRYGYLDGRFSVFDYGCGRGDDLATLRAQGLEANGWDPYFANDGVRRPSDVVNLGFVVNVVEDLVERHEALTRAFALAGKVLAVAAMIGGEGEYERLRLYRDGVLTGRGTFQKYYSQQELRDYIAATLDREPVAVAPGVFLVFRRDEDEQEFLLARYRTCRPPPMPMREPRQPREPREPRPARTRAVKVSKWHKHEELLDDLWNFTLALARVPELSEYPREVEVTNAIGSMKSAMAWLLNNRERAPLELAQLQKSDDLLVYFAMNRFDRRRSFAQLSGDIQRDVRAYWGNYPNALQEATKLLFRAGDVSSLVAESQRAAAAEIAVADDNALFVLPQNIPLMPAVLRVYVGCGERLFGDANQCQVVKLHITSGKVSFLSYREFDTAATPLLVERTKVDLKRQQLYWFSRKEAPDSREEFLSEALTQRLRATSVGATEA